VYYATKLIGEHDYDNMDFIIGKLPVNRIPSIIHPAAVESGFIEPPPPVISREQKYSTELEASVPALPPKPNNNWLVNCKLYLEYYSCTTNTAI
jgi:hypothetical protein